MPARADAAPPPAPTQTGTRPAATSRDRVSTEACSAGESELNSPVPHATNSAPAPAAMWLSTFSASASRLTSRSSVNGVRGNASRPSSSISFCAISFRSLSFFGFGRVWPSSGGHGRAFLRRGGDVGGGVHGVDDLIGGRAALGGEQPEADVQGERDQDRRRDQHRLVRVEHVVAEGVVEQA